MNVKVPPTPPERKPYIVKYDYDDMYGFGTIVIFAYDMDDAIQQLRRHMIEMKDTKWIDHTYNQNTFRWVSKNVYGWNTYFNDSANTCVKIREVDTTCGLIIPVQEHFEVAEIKK